ncbi:MAG: hypothetical protein NVS3B26_16380 [Mycobacteriales bacterium]
MTSCDGWAIRKLVPDEVQVVGAVLGLARLHQDNGMYLVAWEAATPVGHLHLALTDPPELQDVAVRPDYHRRGIASALVCAAEAEARSRQFEVVLLQVSVESTAAQALYRANGYADAGLPPRRVHGTVMLRSGPIEVDDTLVTWQKRLA